MTRKARSKPLRYLMQHGWVLEVDFGLDYGCGRGFDFKSLGKRWKGFDPNYYPVDPGEGFDVITCIYVLNVVLPEEWGEILGDIAARLDTGHTPVAFIAVRRDLWKDGDREPKWGVGCWQHYVDLQLPTVVENSQFTIYHASKVLLGMEAERLKGVAV
jgi:hypothetical protein